MAYFNLTAANAAMTFAGVTLTCLQSIEVSRSAPQTEIECSGSSAVTFITGTPRYTITVTGALDEDDVTLLGAIDPGDNGAITMDPAGTATGTIDIASSSATVTDAPISMPVNGFSTYSATFACDDLTISANT